MSDVKKITVLADECNIIRFLFALAKSSVCPLGEEYCTGCGHISDEYCAICLYRHIAFITVEEKKEV